ncbi:hypothetical protein HMPREF1424_00354, partial [Helicobacter pylori GAM42Ai]
LFWVGLFGGFYGFCVLDFCSKFFACLFCLSFFIVLFKGF